jgi:hypothetical protein
MRALSKPIAALLAAVMLLHPIIALAVETKVLPAGTRIYLVTDQEVSSKRGEADAGMPVMCRVWRDVDVNGTVFIKGGTPASCRVDKVKRSNMGGVEGKVSIGGIETQSADGRSVILQGGYNKEGSGRKAVVWTVGLLLLWPVLFVPGGAAVLPPGTVFDASTVSNLSMDVESASRPRLNLGSVMGGASAEILLDDFLAQSKPETLKVRLKMPGESIRLDSVKIDSVNGKPVEPIAMKVLESKVEDGDVTAICEVKIKPLAKHFQKGINRFEVAYFGGPERVGTEVVLDVQM